MASIVIGVYLIYTAGEEHGRQLAASVPERQPEIVCISPKLEHFITATMAAAAREVGPLPNLPRGCPPSP